MNLYSCKVPTETIYGYNIQHLALIARILAKENLPPERVAEALTDIGRIVAIVNEEFEESLRRSIIQCFAENRLKNMPLENAKQIMK